MVEFLESSWFSKNLPLRPLTHSLSLTFGHLANLCPSWASHPTSWEDSSLRMPWVRSNALLHLVVWPSSILYTYALGFPLMRSHAYHPHKIWRVEGICFSEHLTFYCYSPHFAAVCSRGLHCNNSNTMFLLAGHLRMQIHR